MRSGECVLPPESEIARHMSCKRENEEEVNRYFKYVEEN